MSRKHFSAEVFRVPMAALLLLMACTTQASQYEAVDLCHVLSTPRAYAEKKITFRGSVYVGMENTNISDGKCPGKAADLRVSDAVYQHADIRALHKKISGWQMHGFATVFGTLSVTDDPLNPVTLNVDRVTNITRNDKD